MPYFSCPVKTVFSAGIIFSTLTTQSADQELEADGGSRAPRAAELCMSLSSRELRWAGEVTLHLGTASCSSRCKGTWLGARACAKACEGTGGDYKFCNQLAVHFLYFCLRLGHSNALANNPLVDINDKTHTKRAYLSWDMLVLLSYWNYYCYY